MDEKMFELMTKMYNDIQEMKSTMATKEDLVQVKTELKAEIAEVRTELKAEIAEVRTELKTEIAEVKTNVETVRKDVVRLENNLLNKVGALFDAREVQIDRETEIITKLIQVQNKVDKIDLKIVRNA